MVTAYFRYAVLRQMFPPKATFTEKDVPDLTGKVYIVTGANAGVGRELTRILYAAGGTVYMACRSEAKARAALEGIVADVAKEASGTAAKVGRLEFLQIDLADLRTVAPAAAAFRAKEKQLHVLFNNAGVMLPLDTWGPEAARTAQGYDMQLGTNCIAPFLLTQLLTPVLAATAADPATAPGTVRVVWVASMATELLGGAKGLDVASLVPGDAAAAGADGSPRDYREPPASGGVRYGKSKAGNYLHAVGYAVRHGAGHDNIVSIALNPGNLDSDLYRTVGGSGNDKANEGYSVASVLKATFHAGLSLTLYPSVYGAYTELWAGFSPDVTLARASEGAWVVPWGRFSPMRKSILDYALPVSAGGDGGGEAFYDWTLNQIKPYLQG